MRGITAALLLLSLALSEGVMVCYYASWSVYREDAGKFAVEDIDPFLCTHAVYGFAKLGAFNRIQAGDRWNDLCGFDRNCGYQRFNDLKKINPELKTLLSIGGWNAGSEGFSEMVSDAGSRMVFIDSVLSMLTQHNFDGLDFDWEYPTQRGGAPEDKENFVLLMEELGSALRDAGFMLTAPVSSAKDTIDAAYDVPRLAAAVDFINLMAYDFHGPWETFTHHHTILYPYPEDTGDVASLNVDFAVNYLLEQGAPASKVVLGAATYGRCWTLDDASVNGMYAPAATPGAAGPYTRSPGLLAYNELCEMNMNSPWTIVNEEDMNEPYAYDVNFENTWCSFDDHDSMVNKASYALEKNLAGMMVWSIDTDDFLGSCGSRPFELIATLVETFNGAAVKSKAPTPTEHCQQPGNNPNPEDCTTYYQCDTEGDVYTEELATCPEGTLFNPEALMCDRDYAVCHLEGNYCPANC